MYSPPPMDGFSPPPMSDFSPPPMEDMSPLNDFPPPINGFSPPDDDEGVDADDHFDFGICDTSYDLTGLSEKMNSLEFDKIQNLPPREILELKKESSELNSLYSNNLKIEATEQVDANEHNNDDEHTNGVCVNVIDGDDNGAFNSDAGEGDTGDPIPLNSSLSDEVTSIAISDSDSSGQGDSIRVADLENNIEHMTTDDKVEEYINPDNDQGAELKNEDRPTDSNPVSDASHGTNNVVNNLVQSDEDEDDLFVKSTSWNDPIQTLPDSPTSTPNPTVATVNEDIKNTEPPDDEWGEFPDESKVDASWGDFEEGPNSGEWGDFDNSSKVDIAGERTKSEVRQIEFDEFSDDEFGDFGEANTNSEKIPDKVQEQSLASQLERLEGVGENLVNSVFGGKTKAFNAENVSSELDLEKEVLDDSEVFQPIENPALTPGLDYKWRDSATYTIMLHTLGIDSRVVLDGEGWRSSVPRYSPKTAATLLTPGLLTPQPVSSSGEKQEEPSKENKDTSGNGGVVTPAEFDWNNSGLTNPLEENGLSEEKAAQKSKETPKVITELLASQNNQRLAEKKSLTVLQKHTSREAKNILDGFPLLNFMTSSVLMFPTKSMDKKK